MSKVKIRPESNWENYLLKADQFLQSAQDAYKKESWNSVGLNAVHSAISANDAMTSYLAGVRSASDNHSDAAELLMECSKDKKEAAAFLKHFSWLINRKNMIEYESRLFYQKEALDCLRHADRFLAWAKERIGD